MSDHLWDPKAPREPETARVERALSPLRYEPRGYELPAEAERGDCAVQDAPVPAALGARVRRLAAAALAAGLLALAAWRWWPGQGSAAPGAGDFVVEEVHGDVRFDGPRGSSLSPGDRVVCPGGASARLRVGGIGSLQLEQDSILRIERDADQEKRVYLEQGALVASIFAAPRVFQVGTPSGIAVDLGCVYRARVRPDGAADLEVISGRVSFESAGRKSLVPAGAGCRADPVRGPGTPVWKDASADVRAAIERIDEAGEAVPSEHDLEQLSALERPRDSLSLWHLLGHASGRVRATAYERLSILSPPPAGVTRDECMARDDLALQTWQDELGRLW